MLTSNVKKLFFMAVTAVMLFSSCKSTYFQVYDVKSNAMQQQDNSLVYENGDMKVMYNLWADGGSMSFIVQNKTDRDLFLDMGQSFLIYNGEASDYFQNRTYSRMLSNTQAIGYGISQSYSSVGFWPDAYIVPGKKSLFAKIVKGSSSAVTFQEKEIVCVPAQSFKVIHGQKFSQTIKMTCNKDVDYPSKSASVGMYNESSSPIKIRNRISYSFDEKGSDLKQIENDFYISSITNYSKKTATEKVKVKEGCSKLKVKKRYFKIGGPNKFFLPYRRVSIL